MLLLCITTFITVGYYANLDNHDYHSIHLDRGDTELLLNETGHEWRLYSSQSFVDEERGGSKDIDARPIESELYLPADLDASATSAIISVKMVSASNTGVVGSTSSSDGEL